MLVDVFREDLARVRVTQVMGMLRIAPEIQEQIQSLPDTVRHPRVTERMLRPLETISYRREQIREYLKFLA